MPAKSSQKTEGKRQILERMIGAVVLVGLAVIFIPMLLSGDKDEGIPLFGSNIPSKPSRIENLKDLEIKSTAKPLTHVAPLRIPVDEHSPKRVSTAQTKPKSAPDPAKKQADSKTTQQLAKASAKPATPAQKKIPLTASSVQPKKKEQSAKPKLPKAWAVQVGSFNSQTRAMALRDKLRTKKFLAFVEVVSTSKGDVYRVRVGPEVRRSQAKKLQKRLQAELKQKSLVVRHP